MRKNDMKSEDWLVPKGTEKRRLARILAMQFVYQLDIQKGKCLELIETFLEDNSEGDIKVKRLARRLIDGTWRGLTAVDNMIKRSCKNWDFNRIDGVDKSNLRVAAYQLLECTDVPPKVVINEAIDIAKIYSSVQSPRFINGILDAILKDMGIMPGSEKQTNTIEVDQ